MKKVEIINMYKHNIVYKNIKKVNAKNLAMTMGLCFIIVFSFCYICGVNVFINNSVSVFNPISELYRDVETASFVSAGSINFIAPVNTKLYKINGDSIDFTVDESIVVCAPETGVVSEIERGGNGQSKYIRIQHSDNIFSTIKNVKIIGVEKGEAVKQGKIIGSSNKDDIINFEIIIDGNKASNLYFNKSFIKWKAR